MIPKYILFTFHQQISSRPDATQSHPDVYGTTVCHPKGVRMALGWHAVVPLTSGCPMAIRTPLVQHRMATGQHRMATGQHRMATG